MDAHGGRYVDNRAGSMIKRCKEILKLIRVKHYIKNGLIFFPMFFSGNLTDIDILYKNMIGFVLFSLVSSIIYIFNDMQDIISDREDQIKKMRPLAAGTISIHQAIMILMGLSVGTIAILRKMPVGWYILIIYFVVNIFYSMKGKYIPLVDVAILVSGYAMRLVYGGIVSGVKVTDWMFLTVLSAAAFMGFGKRRNELVRSRGDLRKNLDRYTEAFLNSCCQLFITLTIVFYSLTCVDANTTVAGQGINFIYTVPILLLILLRYNMILLSGDSDGDPVDMFYRDKSIILAVVGYICICMILLY